MNIFFLFLSYVHIISTTIISPRFMYSVFPYQIQLSLPNFLAASSQIEYTVDNSVESSREVIECKSLHSHKSS
jgi:hypothetical protein